MSMKLSDHDLRQIDEAYIRSLSHKAVAELSLKLLVDQKEARDRLNQNASNSSVPSGQFPPWATEKPADPPEKDSKEEEKEDSLDDPHKNEDTKEPSPQDGKPKKAGRQPGASGHGSKLSMVVTSEKTHRADECAGCSKPLEAQAPFCARTGLYVVDVIRAEGTLAGLEVTCTKHVYGDTKSTTTFIKRGLNSA